MGRSPYIARDRQEVKFDDPNTPPVTPEPEKQPEPVVQQQVIEVQEVPQDPLQSITAALKGKNKGNQRITVTTTTGAAPLNGTHSKLPQRSNFLQMLDEVAAKGLTDEYWLDISQILPKPSEYKNVKPMYVDDLKTVLKDVYGGGLFRVYLVRNGESIGDMQFTTGEAKADKPSEDDPIQEAERQIALKRKQRQLREVDLELRRVEESAQPAKPDALSDVLKELKTIVAAPQKSTLTELVPLLSALAPILAPLLSRQPDTSVADGMKAIAAAMEKSNERTLSAIEKLATANNPRGDEMKEWRSLAMDLLKTKNNQGDMFTMYREIEKQERERRRELREEILDTIPRDDDEIDVDPERPIASVFAGVLKLGFKAFNRFMKDPQAGAALASLAHSIGKAPHQVTAQDTPQLQAAAAAQLGHKSVPRLVVPNPPQEFIPESQQMAPVGETITVLSSVPPSPQASDVAPIGASSVAEAPSPSSTTAQQAPVITQEAVITPQDHDEDLRAGVTEAMRQACLDLDADRNEPQWIYFANDDWPKEFRAAFVAATEYKAKMDMIKSKCDSKVFDELSRRVMSDPAKALKFEGAIYSLSVLINNPGDVVAVPNASDATTTAA